LAALDRLEESVVSFCSALGGATETDRLDNIDASLGEALVGLGHYDVTLATCHAMSGLRPEVAEWNESLIRLLFGRFAEGWRKVEAVGMSPTTIGRAW
jgi:hypothetical protein